ncbi:hypothetical protein VTK73DRAFT_7291 [Phialemonium thermophilum]|uniref:NADPH-dependent FMN reductase-like domain-containing protein n=1 Tax=Phialemonium thermophilum TaxID=223376 RepID=A0ABR3WFD2_9PEZI
MSSKSVAVITFSTRTPRVGPEVAALVKEYIAKDAEASGIKLASIDLADFKLPVFDEAVIPAMIPDKGTFKNPHSIAWSEAIKAHDAYVLVIPEYNYGVTGGTKNAIDYLKKEWDGKPAIVVSYGISGGKTANEQVSNSLSMMGLRVAATKPQLAFQPQYGPDMYTAMFEGKLGEETKKEWAEKGSLEVLKAWDELKVLLAQEPAKEEAKA